MKLLVLLGVVAVAATGGISYAALRSAPAPQRPLPHWGLYSDAQWDGLATAFERRGYVHGSVELVTGTSTTPDGKHPFALLSARSRSGGRCFAAARGSVLGPVTCTLGKPLTVYRFRGTVLALASPRVRSVTATSGGRTANVELPAIGGGLHAFNIGGPAPIGFAVTVR